MTGRSDHFDGRRFFNPAGAVLPTFRKVWRMLGTRRTPWPRRVGVSPSPFPRALRADEDAIVTFIGHSTFLIQTADGNILTDPIYAERAGPFGVAGPRRVGRPGVAFNDLPGIDVVLLSHNHYDHCDVNALGALARRHSPVFITPLGNAPILRRAGARRIEELDWWETGTNAPIRITLTPAQHFSARTPFDRNRALWGGFVIAVRDRRIFFAGDTGYAPHFRELRRRIGPMDVALLPIGAYEPRWFMQAIHMNPDEAVRAHLEIGARQSIASHFGTFQLTPEGIDEPVEALGAALRDHGVPQGDFRALEVGESLAMAKSG